jgi:hypothetical protein
MWLEDPANQTSHKTYHIHSKKTLGTCGSKVQIITNLEDLARHRQHPQDEWLENSADLISQKIYHSTGCTFRMFC